MKLKRAMINCQLGLAVCFALTAIPTLFLFYPITSFGQEVTFSWSYTPEQEAQIDKFIIYNGRHLPELDDIDKTARTVSFDYGNLNCEAFYITAYKNAAEATEDVPAAPAMESDQSDIIAFCPDSNLPAPAGDFSISGTVKLVPVH